MAENTMLSPCPSCGKVLQFAFAEWNTRALTPSPQSWVCAKCGAGSVEHGMPNHPASQCVYEPTLIIVPGALTPKQAAADVMFDTLKDAFDMLGDLQKQSSWEFPDLMPRIEAALAKAGQQPQESGK